MAQTRIIGDAIVITSTLKLEDIKNVQKHRPAACSLWGGEDGKEELFRISAKDAGSISNMGIVFGAASRDAGKFAEMTIVAPEMGNDPKEYVTENYGVVLANLNKLEQQLPGVIAEIAAEKAAVMAGITVVGAAPAVNATPGV